MLGAMKNIAPISFNICNFGFFSENSVQKDNF